MLDVPVLLLPGRPRTIRQLHAARDWLTSQTSSGARMLFVPGREDLSSIQLVEAFGAVFCARARAGVTAPLGPHKVAVATVRRLQSHTRSWPNGPVAALWPSLDHLRIVVHRLRPTALAIAADDPTAILRWLAPAVAAARTS